MAPTDVVDIPDARVPDREYRIDAGGVGIALHEWGDAPSLCPVNCWRMMHRVVSRWGFADRFQTGGALAWD